MLAAVILSGGASRRMGSPKALVSYQGASFLEHLLSVTRHPVIGVRRVVLGPDAEEIAISITAEIVAVRRNWSSAQHKKLRREVREPAINAVKPWR